MALNYILLVSKNSKGDLCPSLIYSLTKSVLSEVHSEWPLIRKSCCFRNLAIQGYDFA